MRALQERVAPVTLSREHTRPVPDPLAPLFAVGGLPQGQVIGFTGAGSWSIALALAGTALGEDGWLATVGVEDLGLLAAAEYGVRLDRLLLVTTPPADRLAATVAALTEAVDLVALAPHRTLGHSQARRLAATCRERGTNLLLLDGGRRWPLPTDLTITTTPERWEGIGQGHGHLQQRRLTVEAVGRRAAARVRRITVLAPGPGGGVAPAAPVALTPVADPPTDTLAPVADPLAGDSPVGASGSLLDTSVDTSVDTASVA
ncbi:MAG: hypothetical protein AAF962_21505 [Actinomycetota bacterium]